MKYRLFKSIFFTCVSVFLLTFLVLPGWMYHTMNRDDRTFLENETVLAAAVLRSGGVEELSSAKPQKSRVTWFDCDGKVLYDTGKYPAEEQVPEEVIQALKTGSAFRGDGLQNVSYYAKRLEDGTVLRLSAPRHSVFELGLQMFTPLVLLVFLLVALSAVIASKIAKAATEPLNKIDPARPDERDVDEELKPLVRRVAEQNRRIQSQMRALSKEHARQDQLRREFTANVSHELKTPLTSISGFAELIRDGMVRSEDVRPFAGRIYDETQRLITLVGDILKLSRLEDKAGIPEKEPLCLCDEAKAVLNQLEPVAQRQDISLKLEGTQGRITAIRRVVGEMLHNLCDNAIKYNRPGGSVTVTVVDREDAVCVTVADTGIGIPPEDVPRIFERFYRVDKSHSRDVGGTGLGLSIVKHGAAVHGAEVSVQSTPGEGTSITLTFPKKGESL